MQTLVPKLARLLFVCMLITSCNKESFKDPGPPEPEPDKEVPETLPPVQKAVNVNINSNIGGYLEAKPARYDSTTRRYPLLVFLHGVGELGNGTTDLAKVANNAVPALIKNKKFPPSFKVGDSTYSFIVISPQFKAGPSPDDVKAVINHALSKYRIDTTRMYVSGLSMGGGLTWEYAAVYGSRVAAVVPICGASGPTDVKAQKIANVRLPVWAFHNKNDSTVTYLNSTGYVNKINALNPTYPAKLTLWETGGHNAWTKAADPATKVDNKNMYEWMLQYHR